MSNFRFTHSSLKRLDKPSLYKMLYAIFTTPLTRGQIINELESRIQHQTYIDRNNKKYRNFDLKQPEYAMLRQTVTELKQADLEIELINGGN